MSEQYLAAVAADTHLDRHNWSGRPELNGDSRFSFQQIVDFAELHDIPLLLAGDVFDKAYPDADTVHFAVKQLQRLKNVGQIQGQHEMQRGLPWLSLAEPQVKHLHRKVWDFGPLLYGMDFVPAARIKEELLKIPKEADVILCHQVFSERMGLHCGSELAFKDLPYVTTAISGDFHQHIITEVTAADGRVIKCVSPGSSNLRAIDEDNSKFFFAWKKDLSFVSIPIKTRPVYRIRAISPEAFERDLATLKHLVVPDTSLPESVQKPILQVSFYDAVHDVVSRVNKAIGNNAFLFFKALTNNAKAEVEANDASESYQSGLAGHLHMVAPPDSAEFNTAMRLLRAQDRKAELAAVMQEALAAPDPV